MSILISLALLDEAAEIRKLLVETWHHTYDSLIGVDIVKAQTQKWHSVESIKSQIITLGDSFLVAKYEERIVGHSLVDLAITNRFI